MIRSYYPIKTTRKCFDCETFAGCFIPVILFRTEKPAKNTPESTGTLDFIVRFRVRRSIIGRFFRSISLFQIGYSVVQMDSPVFVQPYCDLCADWNEKEADDEEQSDPKDTDSDATGKDSAANSGDDISSDDAEQSQDAEKEPNVGNQSDSKDTDSESTNGSDSALSGK
jgi:hypothetical protein